MGRQHDAWDVFAPILDLLHRDINKSAILHCEDPEPDEHLTADEHWHRSRQQDSSVIVDTFEGQLGSLLCCPKHPAQKSIRYELFRAIALPVPDDAATRHDTAPVTLTSCLANFFSVETGIEWWCEECAANVSAAKKMVLCHIPSVVCIHLKRFSFATGVAKKIDAFVDFPFEVFFDEFLGNETVDDDMLSTLSTDGDAADCVGEPVSTQKSGSSHERDIIDDASASPSSEPSIVVDGVRVGDAPVEAAQGDTSLRGDLQARDHWISGQHLYELIAVSNQEGLLTSGHYTAFTKRGTQWYFCDDESIKPRDWETVPTSSAYLLFYQRVATENVRPYLKRLISQAGIAVPDALSDTELRSRAWEARKSLLEEAKAKADATKQALLEAQKVALIAELEQELKITLDACDKRIDSAAIEPIPDAVIHNLSRRVSAAQENGLSDSALLARATQTIAKLKEVAASQGNLIESLNDEVLRKIIATAGMVGPPSDATVDDVRAQARRAQALYLTAKKSVAQLVDVPHAYNPSKDPPLLVTNPFTGATQALPAHAVPGQACFLTIEKPEEKLSLLRALGLSDENQCLEALARAGGDVQSAAESIFDAEQSQVADPVTDAIFNVPMECAQTVIPGQTLVVFDPFIHRVCLRQIPHDWQHGQPIVLSFSKPLNCLQGFRKHGIFDEKECLQALRESRGSYRNALYRLVSAASRQNEDDLQVVSGEPVVDGTRVQSTVEVMFASYRNRFADAQPGQVVILTNPFTGEEIRHALPKDWRHNVPVRLQLPKPKQKLNRLSKIVPALPEKTYVFALVCAKGIVDEAAAQLRRLIEFRRLADSKVKSLSDAECIDYLQAHNFDVKVAAWSLDIGLPAIRKFHATGDFSAFQARIVEMAYARSQEKKRQHFAEFFEKLKATASQMGLSDISEEKVKALVAYFGYQMEAIIGELVS